MVLEHSFKKMDLCITLTSKTFFNIDNEQSWCKLLFPRLITVGANAVEFPSHFKYELCSYALMLQATKPVLADTIWPYIACATVEA